MNPIPRSRAQAGFTLVELIAVVVIVAVIGSLGSSYFLQFLESQKAIQERIDLFSRSRLAVNLMARELENALPSSVRATAGGQCVEFIPVVGGGLLEDETATSANGASGSSTLDLLAYSVDRGSANFIVAGGVNSADVFSGAALAALASPIGVGQGGGTINLASATVFAQSASSRRVYFVSGSKAFCVFQGALYEYSSASISATGFVPTAVGTLVDHEISSGGFAVQSGAQNNGAQLNVDLVFGQGGAQFPSNDRIYIRNVP
ncbi:PulJ/GspJ family protein [Pseudoteredinibacter isoporae]|uniref:MSHA biogenesis protein MshO n=1 Tax=Pseudoteredinibacter isoporae TaxID=570281 RepID=A0A7X0JV81_9GAMM|nr:prepilin-type N-terminal cleavage/methylation domain-containing protein [Pseudoteredinibacter isoporae]MBB6522353.1 MSHA biogenesis protein MshO [Pseudoteredinibacter isoporae]NHO87886.1 prepilin-type N-terminal cleavage/methylation domain-containing protein [Pseudoteredinibacter isoporae]NIB23783.1 prepilin-type N-terminal cleavage/methylation domain-containing protein [Pseudoteredinibacter isoporae]